jgi:uncharacterized protein (DUF433 family)
MASCLDVPYSSTFNSGTSAIQRPSTSRSSSIPVGLGEFRPLSEVAPEVRYDEGVQELRRITVNPAIMGGKACIRGMRVTVGMIVESIATGRSIPELLADFPYLEEQDIREALAYAAGLAQGRDIRLAS